MVRKPTERPLGDGNDGLIVCNPRVGGRPRRICGTAQDQETSSALALRKNYNGSGVPDARPN